MRFYWSMDSMDWVVSVSCLVYNGVESTVPIVVIFYFTDGTVWFHQGIFPFDGITVAFFALLFDIAGVRILHAIIEVIFGMSLDENVY